MKNCLKVLSIFVLGGMGFSSCQNESGAKYVVTAKGDNKITFETLDALRTRRVMEFDYKTDSYNSRIFYQTLAIGDTIMMMWAPGSEEYIVPNTYFSRYGDMQRICRINGCYARDIVNTRLRQPQRDSIIHEICSTRRK